MESLEIPVIYQNQERSFKAYVQRFGYVQQILVDLYGTQVTIERDEEGNYRALGDVEKMKEAKVDLGLVEAVINVLEAL
jgi:uncharacterized membrane protein